MYLYSWASYPGEIPRVLAATPFMGRGWGGFPIVEYTENVKLPF